MASKEVEEYDEPPRQETWRDFLYNSHKGTVLGRTGISWLKISVFYVIFYSCLAGWFAGLLHGFYSTLDDVAPRHYGVNSLTKANPALGVRPMPLFDSTMIRFSQGIRSSARPYVDHLEAFLKTYEPNPDNKIPNCTNHNVTNTEGCVLDVQKYLQDAGCTRGESYGYFEGKPCVALKMNKLFGFTPEPYDNVKDLKDDLKEDEDEMVKYLSFGDGNVGVSCHGQNAVDRQYIKGVTFSPSNGLAMKFFPYMNQNGYRSPIIVAKFKIEPRVTIQVTCKLWAKNIDNSDGKEKRGTVHFEFYMD